MVDVLLLILTALMLGFSISALFNRAIWKSERSYKYIPNSSIVREYRFLYYRDLMIIVVLAVVTFYYVKYGQW